MVKINYIQHICRLLMKILCLRPNPTARFEMFLWKVLCECDIRATYPWSWHRWRLWGGWTGRWPRPVSIWAPPWWGPPPWNYPVGSSFPAFLRAGTVGWNGRSCARCIRSLSSLSVSLLLGSSCFHLLSLLLSPAFSAPSWRADCYAKASGRGRDRTLLPVMADAHAIVLCLRLCVSVCLWVSMCA